MIVLMILWKDRLPASFDAEKSSWILLLRKFIRSTSFGVLKPKVLMRFRVQNPGKPTRPRLQHSANRPRAKDLVQGVLTIPSVRACMTSLV